MACAICAVVADPYAPFVRTSEIGVAFFDANPVTPGHTLVVPRRHTDSILDLGAIHFTWLARDVARTGRWLVDRYDDVTSYNVLLADGPDAGQSVPHVHWHVVPRRANDGLNLWFR